MPFDVSIIIAFVGLSKLRNPNLTFYKTNRQSTYLTKIKTIKALLS